jgi:hypothetical protein
MEMTVGSAMWTPGGVEDLDLVKAARCEASHPVRPVGSTYNPPACQPPLRSAEKPRGTQRTELAPAARAWRSIFLSGG